VAVAGVAETGITVLLFNISIPWYCGSWY